MSKILSGKVISVGKMARTIKVRVENQKKVPLYGKTVTRSKNFLVDVLPEATVKIGDAVKIMEIKPVSKNKYFKLT